MKLLCTLLPLLFLLVQGEQKRYDGYQVLEVHITHTSQVEYLQNLEHTSKIDIIRPAKLGQSGLIMVGPEEMVAVRGSMHHLGIKAHVQNDNIQRDISAEFDRLSARYQNDPLSFDPFDFNTYDAVLDYQYPPKTRVHRDPIPLFASNLLLVAKGDQKIMAQSEVWVEQCPRTFNCSVSTIGQSYEGRNMGVLKIGKTTPAKKGLWFTSTIHAREWLSMTTIQNIIIRLITKYGQDDVVTHLIDNYDFYFLLVANPDGYVYTFDPNGNRLWRKNRKPVSAKCVGVDLNRNFDNHWGKQGASPNPCSDTYPGPSPASEVEIYSLQNAAKSLTQHQKIVAWFPVHCCGQMWMFPYAFTEGYKQNGTCVRTPDYKDLLKVANGAAAAMKAEDGSVWKTGTICEVIYPATGSEADYMYDSCNVKYSWALELHGTSFVVDKSMIKPIFEEFWAGFVGSVKTMEEIKG